MKFAIFLTCIHVGIYTETHAQVTHYFITGIVQENGNNNPVPFANISITNSHRGTAADQHGKFSIKILDKERHEKLKISCVGYISKSMSLDSLKGLPPFIVSLIPDLILIDEIVIKEAPINPASIIQSALDSIKVNYLNTPFNMEYLSAISVTNIASGKEFTLETVLFGFSKGYLSTERKIFEILQRRSSAEDPLNFGSSYWPTFDIHNIDLISSSFKNGILNPKNLDKFNLHYAGVSIFDTDTVYNIEYYVPKPTKGLTGFDIVPKTYKGNIYITTKTNAIIKHELHMDHYSFEIIYKKIEGKYFPYFISGDRMPSKTLALTYKIHNNIILKNLETKNPKSFDHKTNEFDDVDLIPYDSGFWKLNYPK